ncbi:MAG: DUF6178 family protein [Myxococcota bacterium]
MPRPADPSAHPIDPHDDTTDETNEETSDALESDAVDQPGDGTRDLATIAGRSRLPAELQNASGMKKLDWILTQHDTRDFVGALAPQELYYWICDIGKGDAYALLALANTEQIRALVDLDAWSRHELVLPRWLEWLDLALAVDVDTALKFVRAQDDLTFEWLFTGDVHVYASDHDLDFVPDDLAAFHSPDGLYLVTVPRDHPLEERLPQLMKLMWAEDQERARLLLQQAQFELNASITEDMERFRNGRIQDLGFEPVTEALEVYTTVPVKALRDELRKGRAYDGATVSGPTITGMVGDLVLRDVPAPELLGAALDGLDGAARTRATEGLAYLVNKVFMAETGDLARFDDLPIAARHAAAVANLGLDYLADSSIDQAIAVLATTTPETLFRSGHTLTVELGKKARAVQKRAGGRDGLALFGSPVDEMLHAATLARPLFYEGLDDPKRMGHRAFQTLDDVAKVEARVADAAALVDFFEQRFGFTPAAIHQLALGKDQLGRLRFATLFRTAMVWALLKDELVFDRVGPDELAAFARAAFEGRGAAARFSPAMQKALLAVQGSDVPDAVRSFVERAFDELLDVLGPVPAAELETRYAADLFLVRSA